MVLLVVAVVVDVRSSLFVVRCSLLVDCCLSVVIVCSLCVAVVC